MSDISPISTSSPHRVGRGSIDSSIQLSRTSEDVRARGGDRKKDRVELSSVSKYLSQLQTEPPQRTALINRVQSQIQAGTYLSDKKLAHTASEIASDLNIEISRGR